MHIFYSSRLDGDVFILDEAESMHLSRVLRLKVGDEVQVINGSGSLYHCNVVSNDKKESKLKISSLIDNYDNRDYYLHIAIAPTKNIDRFEWFIEKCVEMGIDKITPIICERSERRVIKTERSRRIIVSAMKQSIKAKETEICEALPFKEIVKDKSLANRFITHCMPGNSPGKFSDMVNPGDHGLVLIGPEGDFSSDELKLAINEGFKELSLGDSRLRTETAGLVACSMFYILNQ